LFGVRAFTLSQQNAAPRAAAPFAPR